MLDKASSVFLTTGLGCVSCFFSGLVMGGVFFLGSFFSGLGILGVLPSSEPKSLRSIFGAVSPWLLSI
jgi:hypothetical protein